MELYANPGRVVSHGRLLERIWGSEYAGNTQIVRAFVKKLRRKLGDDARAPTRIFTEPGVGFRMAKGDGE